MKKYGWMTAALLLAVVGCQRREIMYLGDDVAPIHFSVAYQDAEVSAAAGSSQVPQTKALVNLDKGVTVRVLAFKRSATNSGGADPRYDDFVAECTYVADGSGGLTPCAVKADGTADASGTVPDAISLNNGTYDFYAYSPALPVTKGGSSNNPYIVNGITHGMDVLNATLSGKAVSKAAATVALVFEHKCSKITFNVKQPEGADVTKLKVDSVVLRKMNNPSNVSPWWIHQDLTGGIGTDNDTCLFKTFGDLNDNTDPSDPQLIGRTGFGCVLPKQNDGSKVPVNIYLTLGDSAYLFKTEFPAVEYLKGKHYTYNMNFKQTEVEFTLNVVAWNNVSINTGDMGGDGFTGGILVGSWFQRYNSSADLGEDNVAGDIGGWKPVSPDWTIGTATGSKPSGGIGGWDDVDVDQKPGGSGSGSNPGGGIGGWDDVNDNQPGVGA
ncbi:fimbrillin family protein [uncultured Rikenella sp.]|uniref:BF2992 family fimbrillin-A clan protein n=1 Tax=uncultured Rikenella sp. TaxID=368003 RepID=UPI0025E8CC04|nr:fimbrillin family protein [uncultured Rikenella sp.]